MKTAVYLSMEGGRGKMSDGHTMQAFDASRCEDIGRYIATHIYIYIYVYAYFTNASACVKFFYRS